MLRTAFQGMRMRAAYLLVCASFVSACGSDSGHDRGINSIERSVSQSEFASRIKEFESGYRAAVAFPEFASLPVAGAGVYAGQLAFDYAGDARGTAHANLKLDVDLESGKVTGRAGQFAFSSADGATDVLSGSLEVAGQARDGGLIADLEGVLNGPSSGPYRQISGTAELQGAFRGLNGRAEKIAGTMDGTFQGSSSLDITSGAFFVEVITP
jgi:hypothetical protein